VSGEVIAGVRGRVLDERHRFPEMPGFRMGFLMGTDLKGWYESILRGPSDLTVLAGSEVWRKMRALSARL
jgi:hypothetical protein